MEVNNMRKTIATISLILLSGLLLGLNLKLNVDPSALGKASADYPVLLEPGHPMLNYYALKVLLPFGEEFSSAELRMSAAAEVRSGIQIDFAQNQVPISQAPTFVPISADPEVYETDAWYPRQDFEYMGTHYYRGFAIAFFNVYPFRYNPVSKELLVHNSFEITINSVFSEDIAYQQAGFVTPHESTLQQLQRLVANPQQQLSYKAYASYKSPARNLNPADAKSLLIITDEPRLPWFADYTAWKESKGISTGIYTTAYIYQNYTGVDEAEKVRNFIIDAYNTWADTDTPLEYVILGGDDEIVPERGVFGRVGSTLDNRMPSDLYYSNLDGDWNANENTIYGELQDDTDMIPEVHIGRFPAETYLEFNNIFRKIMYYVDYSTYSNNIAIFYGENLNNNPVTWGGDYKDDVALHLPGDYYYSTQYQRDGSYSSTSVFNSINDGVNVMNHMGHSNETSLLGQSSSTIHQMQNTEYGFLYSQGCYPAAFDQRTSAEGESVGENFLLASGGLFSFVGNTRYGWYMPGGINGASQYYDREFFIGLYEEGQSELGAALTYSRLQNLNSALQNDVMRWCYMEMILFGDPSVAIKMPDHELPLLSLESYEFDDSQGDNDGIINPGETIRFYPVVRNAAGWGTAHDVSIRLETLPAGMQTTGECILVNQILPGQTNPEDLYIELSLPDDLGFGIFNFQVVIESFHPLTFLSTGSRTFDASFEITLFDSHFPWETSNSGRSAPMVADINSDGEMDIIYTDVFGGVYMIGADGEVFDFFAHQDQQNINRSAAMGQIDGLGGDDLAFTSRTGHIYAITTEGELIFDYATGIALLFTPILADITNDGNAEIIAGSMDGKIYVIDANGEDVPGFPLQLNGTYQTELAVGDLDADNLMKIVAGTSSGEIKVIAAGGVWDERYSHNLGSAITGAPVILNNGRFALATNTHLYLIDATGILFQKEIDAPVAGGLITADLDQNGALDIIFVSLAGKLWVVNQNGSDLAGFPVTLQDNFNCPPLVADIDADDQYEVILHSYLNNIYAYKHDGTPLEGLPFFTTYNGATPGTLIDYDGSGFFKLITGFSNGVLMSNLRRPASELTPWTTYRGSLKRQGYYATTGFVANSDLQMNPPVNTLKQNYPNPFNPNTTIAFELSKAAFVKIEIYNTKGQKVRSLLADNLESGSHTLNWDATDDQGRSLASGVYFYRMQSDMHTQTRKMLLLK